MGVSVVILQRDKFLNGFVDGLKHSKIWPMKEKFDKNIKRL